ncbi:uncharacterized protein [Choristoneura fumiferana]|uniref:uncharacterized protein n=1 Tax=Choristoneura fumiferana TaxID=7141 RepID=UPI003D153DE1
MRVFSTGAFVIISISSCAAWWEDDDDSVNETRTRLKHDMVFMRTLVDYVKEDILVIYTLIALQKHLEERLDLCLITFGDDNITEVSAAETSITTTASTRVIKTPKTKDYYEVSESIEHTTTRGFRQKLKTTLFQPKRFTGIEDTFEYDDYSISDQDKKVVRVLPPTPNHYAFQTMPKQLRALDHNDSNEGIETL